MASVKICDGRTVVYQYDTGVSIELCDCRDFTECHFAVNDGIIRRDVEDNICPVPDAALVNAGTLTVYAFSRNDDGGQTQHTLFIHVMARPKPADYIDPPDEMDNLDQVAARVASIIGPGSGGGAPEIMKITFTSPDGGDNVVPDKTFAEMTEALGAGKLLYAEIAVGIDFFDGQFQLFQATDDVILFVRLGATPGDASMVALQMVGVNSDNEVVSDFVPISGGGGSGAMFVAFTSEDGENWKASKPFAEMYEAYMNGQMVYAIIGEGTILPAMNIDSAAMYFMLQMYDDGVFAAAEITWVSDDSVYYTQNISPIGGGSGNVVAVTLTYDGKTIKPSHTSSEIYNLVTAGNTVLLQYGGATCTANLIGESECVFEHMGYSASGDQMTFGDYMTITIAGDIVTLKDHMPQRSYPNPHPLIINGVEYDGSKRVEMNVSAASSDAVVLADTVTGKQYRLFVANGKLTMDETVSARAAAGELLLADVETGKKYRLRVIDAELTMEEVDGL